MTIGDKLHTYYCEYREDYEAARRAEQKGNFSGALELYRAASRALLEMSKLETGETKKERQLHIMDIVRHMEDLTTKIGSQPQPVQQAEAPQKSQPAPAPAAPKEKAAEKDEDNPWKSEGVPSTTFDDVVGMEDVKKLIRERILDQLRYPELYEQYGLTGGTGILLFGLPGTGKTTIARAIAHEVEAPMYTVKLSDVLNKWVGESEKLIKQLFDKARETESAIIFFDDFDSLGAERRDDGNHNNKIIVELINQMDGFKKNTNMILFLAATNKPWMIDGALMRPGRFEHHVYVPLANHEARKQMIVKNMKGVPMDSDVDLDKISDMMEGYNGGDIVSVVKSAKMAALQRAKGNRTADGDRSEPVTFEDLAQAATDHKSSVKQEDIDQLRLYAQRRGIELPEQM